jgi:hypothetical protein
MKGTTITREKGSIENKIQVMKVVFLFFFSYFVVMMVV